MIRAPTPAPFLHPEESAKYKRALVSAADQKAAADEIQREARELARKNELRRALSHSINRLALAG